MMRFSNPKDLLIFILGCFLSAILLIFGLFILSLGNNHFTATQFFIFGSIFTLVGIFVVSSQSIGDQVRWLLGFSLIAVGFYQFGRASGAIRIAWLSYFGGFACLLAAALILYLVYSQRFLNK